MCGITGILHLDKKNVEPDILTRMNATVVHRGPDAEGYYVKDFVGFAHRRLSIIDLESGAQPMLNADETVSIVFNGEIYNFLEIKKMLQTRDHQFRTNSDTEVILHLYEEYGDKTPKFLDGMFAFAIWDTKKQKLFLARDRIGIKPLYYFVNKDKLIFGSEIKPLLEYGTIPKEIDNTAVLDYLTYGFIPAPKTIFKSIKKLLPAHTLSIDIKTASPIIEKYWDISFAEKLDSDEKEISEKIIEQLHCAVSSHLISDVPLGAFLSGGIDSSAIVASMTKITGKPVTTCSIGFKQQSFSELPYAKEVAKLYNSEHFEYLVTPDAISFIDKILYHYDEPFADTSALPSFYLSKVTRQKVKVALSGDGGDENFAGYRRYVIDKLENSIRKFFPIRPLFLFLSKIYPKADWLPQIFRAKTLLRNLSKTPIDAYFNTVSLYDKNLLDKILTSDFKTSLDGYNSKSVVEDYYMKSDGKNHMDKILYTEIKTFLPDDYLVKVDRASMGNSLEVRVPLLDHKFMEFAAKIPLSLKMKYSQTKYIFKKALEQLLPKSILYRKKQGFEIPIDSWLRKDLNKHVHSVLFKKNSFVSSIIKPEYLEKIWTQHCSGIKNYGNHIWALFLLEAWHDKYLK